MKWMGLNELRSSFFQFFEKKKHMLLGSYPLIPKSDNSLLLINSGMAPMKNWFLGKETPPSKRVVTCQKCIRTPDIDLVGKTDRHGTFFEMLGNFSFGDYFKIEAIKWAWEFVTEDLKMPKDKLYVTVYEEDYEAYDIWLNEIGVELSHVSKLGKDDNFWEIGTGPCGPCSEIYYDRGEQFGCGSEKCGPGCDCDRFIEFWNLVFSQYDKDDDGNYNRMEHPNIDTGMGLERIACVAQGVNNLFEVDTVKKVLDHVCKIANVKYGENADKDVSIRIITDHIRSSVFLISDGVMPSNEGRGYVLRRLIRRAYRNGKKLGINKPFLGDIAETVASENKAAYPDLTANLSYIKQLLLNEELNFEKILDRGMIMLSDLVEQAYLNKSNKISAKDAFKLCDTYGMPFDIVKDFSCEKNIQIDEDGFFELMKQQQERARKAANSNSVGWVKSSARLEAPSTKFIGYNSLESEATVVNIFECEEEIDVADANREVSFIFDKTPFYAESGGQVADTGIVESGEFSAKIIDCQKLPTGQYLHKAVIMSGKVQKGQIVKLLVDKNKRMSVSRNHTAAHILQKVLINVLGEHVHQAGQLVDESRVRFDFNHFQALTKENIAEIESKVNDVIMSGLVVNTEEMEKQRAEKLGAIALFGEKYGDVVRVVKIGDFSMEFCGGTHVDNTSKLGLFKIMSEASVGSGIRRIEAKTGLGLLNYVNSLEDILDKTCSAVKIKNKLEVCEKVTKINDELKQMTKKVEELELSFYEKEYSRVSESSAQKINNVNCVFFEAEGLSSKLLRPFGDIIKSQNSNMVSVICAKNDDKLTLMVVCGKSAIDSGANAGKIVRELSSLVGGKGGGKKDLAMAGLPDANSINLISSEYCKVIQNNVM